MRKFSYKFSVGKDAIDVNNHANNAQYLNWMQDAANAHSRSVGDFIESNLANGVTWMATRNEIDYISQLFLGDEVEILTWVERDRRISTKRYFEFLKGQKVIARAVTTYVFFDINRSRVVAIPDEIYALYEN